jgi:hypothetical protein
MLDQTIVNIVSILMGSVGLIGAITKYDFPKARRTVFGENLFFLKEEIINSTITWSFTVVASIGFIFQIICGEIYSEKIPDRIYQPNTYLSIFIVGIFLSLIMIILVKSLSRAISRFFWEPQIIHKCQENFSLAKNLDSRAEKIISWMEELLEIKDKEKDLLMRIARLEKYYKN